jgi:hypothetical protein
MIQAVMLCREAVDQRAVRSTGVPYIISADKGKVAPLGVGACVSLHRIVPTVNHTYHTHLAAQLTTQRTIHHGLILKLLWTAGTTSRQSTNWDLPEFHG